MKNELDPRDMANLLGSLCRWSSPEVFRMLPVWFPELARKCPLYKADWKDRQKNKKEDKFEGNTKANMTLARVLGVTTKDRPNWTCCHIWGNDDASFKISHSEVNDPRYYSSPANMVLLPTPLKAFTDSIPEVKSALRFASFRLFGFHPEGRDIPSFLEAKDWMPDGWAKGNISGVMPIDNRIRLSAQKRFKKIRDEFQNSPGNYPREQVLDVAKYWRAKVPDSLLETLLS